MSEPRPHYHGLSDEPPQRPTPLLKAKVGTVGAAIASCYTDPNVILWIEYLEYYREKDQQRLAAKDLQIAALTQQVQSLQAQEKQMAITIDQLQTDFDKYKTDVSGALAKLEKSVADLQAELANAPIPPAVQAKLDALDADITTADGIINPPTT